MPLLKTRSGASAGLALALGLATASHATTPKPPYAFLAQAVPIDLDADEPAANLEDTDTAVTDVADDGTPVLTARMAMPEGVDATCRAAANLSNGGDEGTIVACSHGGDTGDQRVAPSLAVDESTRDGALHPPDVSGLPGCIGPCITIRFGHVPPPVYYIDLASIPEAPVGSDAWKIGKGLMRAR